MDTTDEAAITAARHVSTRRGRSSWSRARAAGRSRPRRWRASSGRHVAAPWRTAPDATSSPSPIRARSWRTLAEERGYRETFLNPPDIGGRFSALSLFGLVPGALIGGPMPQMLSRRPPTWRKAAGRRTIRIPGSSSARSSAPRRARARQADACVLPPSLARSASGSNSSSPRARASTARARCRSSTSRWGRRTSTAPTARFVAISTDRDAPDASAARRARSGGPSRAAPEHPHRRARRGVLPLGVRDGGRRRDPRHQSLRRAERRGSQGEDQGDPGAGSFERRRPDAAGGGVSAYSSRFTGSTSAGDVVRAALASLKPRDYVAFLSYLPADPATRDPRSADIRSVDPRADARREHLRRRPALPALDRAVPQGRAEHRSSRS